MADNKLLQVDHAPLGAHDGAWNIAADEALLIGLGEGWAGPTFRSYINPPTVVMGLSRRHALDIDRPACWGRRVAVVRRASGGGTVYHDAGTLNLAWILPWEHLPPGSELKSLKDHTTDLFLGILASALGTLGFPATKTRISDLSIGHPLRKVAGSGQARKSGGVLHHISLLIDMDLAAMSAVLPTPPDRPGIRHRDFVTSLRAAGYTGEAADIHAALLQSTLERLPALTAVETKLGDNATLCRLVETLMERKYAVDEWTYRL